MVKFVTGTNGRDRLKNQYHFNMIITFNACYILDLTHK